MKYYALVTGRVSNGFEDEVTQRLNEGWELQGGVCSTGESDDGEPYFCQAVVLDDGKESLQPRQAAAGKETT